ncbi:MULTISPECIES: bifunctional aspartate kinase/homoserine dehydrogenase I [Mesonia]|uniref:Bifunctional aspartokinase/homoserine dehydrogenase 1 n=1 Tax=Mesonia oceanica TaxID=2687242 RepID=A0AC61YCM8_9FLAO|nr:MULTISPECIES: bifunctional aspartate kinase/homoserine dehydrogenase I [Mesonia]MAN27173.1 bifunctional aspartate kinase/homoserine dehydrogenase I [Mesonia sp.]MAQ42058.1 bifunctional aspartate kinase/homoserine dehydrogenase I [Mesonia sp.]MBJ97585.1 bifunctional aspartate kinase/homoserine dehydrogenase I [Flavobacteriaceae bacterium]VVV02163.1 Bifunctional aspartokinase/homoserine dehydrogenase 1 [Mesonia oceanica]|tara:strand:+ start:21100 stop:23547 length:2448 start_codon:yes stop_codon:yes gene_type:complete
MKVLKFGGTSVANAENIQLVKNIVQKESSSNYLCVVVSALGGVTDLLLDSVFLASQQKEAYQETFQLIEKKHLEVVKKLIPVQQQSSVMSFLKRELNILETLLEGAFLIGETTPKLLDKILGYGEILSSKIIHSYFTAEGISCAYKDSRELIKTNTQFGRALVNFEITEKNLTENITETETQVYLMPGFVASSLAGDSTTLGRGGSDYTAAIVAAALDAEVLEIWTDVSGMFTANPRLVKQAVAIEEISYQEAMELSHFGAKVLYPPTIQPVLAKEIPIHIKNTFLPAEKGTLITKNTNGKNRPVRGISHIENISLLSLEGPGMVGVPGISKRFFEVLSVNEISVVLITQASSEHSICVAVASEDAAKAKEALDQSFAYEISLHRIQPVIVEDHQAIIALVGDNMKSHQGLSGKMFSALGKNNVNIRVIAQGASERNISAVIKKEDVKKALNTLHERFFEENIKQLNLFVMGVGNVGAKFLKQIQQQKKFLKQNFKLNVRVIALSNSRKMYFQEDGISLKNWEENLTKGEKADKELFFEKVKAMNLRNSIFVDNTANEVIAMSYANYLKNSISVVTCNKVASSSAYENYAELKQLSREYNAPFLFETNVGAGLPIIDTLKNLIASGDKVTKIQAVLSGSLNFVFNNFDENHEFVDVVKQAQEEGYTEPDPKIDLSGIDVMRKILILARESGYQLELDDIQNQSFLPEECLQTKTVEDFFTSLATHKDHFNQLFESAKQHNSRLKYVAQFDNGKASVGLEEIPQQHPFYNLEGKDNIVLFYTERYVEQPLIIKGAGAGADVTASGIFADIIRIGNY